MRPLRKSLSRQSDCHEQGKGGCASCLKECPAGAIEFFLGKDMGGGDTYMKAERRGQYLDWKFYHPDGLFKTIEIDRTSSNKY